MGSSLYRTATVSTYIVGFLPFLAEYFWRHAFRSIFTGLRRDVLRAPTSARSYRAATVRESVVVYREERFWFRLRRVRKSVPLFLRTNVFNGATMGLPSRNDEDAS